MANRRLRRVQRRVFILPTVWLLSSLEAANIIVNTQEDLIAPKMGFVPGGRSPYCML